MMELNLPNKITLFRIFLIPIIIVFLISPSFWSCMIAALVFALAAATDWLDGHLARATNQVTVLGKLLDPIADKLLVVAALLPLVELGRVSAWIVVVIIGREIAISGLRIVASAQGITIAASVFGKYKMGAQVATILFMILDFNPVFHFCGQVGIWGVMILSIVSALEYFNQFWDKLDMENTKGIY